MLNSLKTWFGEVTTGHGVMIVSGTLLSVLSGGMTWTGAVPLLAAGVLGVVWPENAALQAVGQVIAKDVAGGGTGSNNQGVTPTSPPTRV